jgi:hypothetical protein
MQNALRWLGIFAAACLLGGGCWLLYTGVLIFWSANDSVRLGTATALISVAALLYNNARQQAREIKSRQFAEKRQAYQKFFDVMFDVFAAQRSGQEISQEETIERIHGFVKEVMIWGSADTINQYNSYIRGVATPLPDGDLRIFSNMENLMRSLRRDLGHNDRVLERLGLTKLLIRGEEHDRLGR